MVAYTNIMETLVEREVQRQLSTLPLRIKASTDPKDLVTFALNRLQPLYARTTEGLEHQLRRGHLEFADQITEAVEAALKTVNIEPLRERVGLDALQQNQTLCQDAFSKLEAILKQGAEADPEIGKETIAIDRAEAQALAANAKKTIEDNKKGPNPLKELFALLESKPVARNGDYKTTAATTPVEMLPAVKPSRKTHEDLARLQRGSKVWNDWRVQNEGTTPNLSRIDLSGTDLTGVDFSNAYLIETQFANACLKGVNFHRAYLKRANLSSACLIGANLRDAALCQANLMEAEVPEVCLRGAYLREACLHGADLRGADLRGVDLSGADLSEANLQGANLEGANLGRANFRGANLHRANLSLVRAKWANFSDANLSDAIARTTNFTGAVFTGVYVKGWQLDSSTVFDYVFCDYIYIDAAKKIRYPQEQRFPLGEFAKLFKRSGRLFAM